MENSDQGNLRSHTAFASPFLRWSFFLLCVSILVASTARLAKSDSSIPVGLRPNRVVISPNGSELYVSNEGSDSITVISTTWRGKISQFIGIAKRSVIPVGKQPAAMAISMDGRRLFVGNRGGFEFHEGNTVTIEGSVSVIDTVKREVSVTIPVGGEILDLAVTPDGRKLYLAIGGSPSERGLKKISMTDDHPISWISRVLCPQAVVFTPDGQRAYVNYQCGYPEGHDPIMVYDAETDTPVPLAVIYGWTKEKPIANVGGPLAISPDGRLVLAAANDACARRDVYHQAEGACPAVNANDAEVPYTARGLVNIIETENNRLIDFFGVVGYDPQNPNRVIGAFRPAFSPDGQHVAVITGIGVWYYPTGNPVGSGNRNPEKTYLTTTRVSDVAFWFAASWTERAFYGNLAYLVLPEENRVQEINIVPPTVTPTIIGVVLVAISLAVLLAVIIVWNVNWRLQRYIRIRFGQRWVFSLGHCNWRVEVATDGLRLHSLDRHAGGGVPKIPVPSDGWPSEITSLRATLHTLYPELEARARVRIEAERSVFDRPWTSVIGEPWSKPDCRIAGQMVYLSPTSFLPIREPSSRIVFQGLRCVKDNVHPDLPWASAEIKEVTKAFQHWGAVVSAPNKDATVSEFVDAMQVSDVVHASTHATSEEVFLVDGSVRGADLKPGSLRCCLLVLSACELGDIRSTDAFLWAALSQGVNIIAATQRVDDYACRVFFYEFYFQLLQHRKVGGVSIADAISAGAKRGRQRYMRAMTSLGQQDITSKWEQTIDSFVLFGDPSLSMELRRG